MAADVCELWTNAHSESGGATDHLLTNPRCKARSLPKALTSCERHNVGQQTAGFSFYLQEALNL